MRPSMGLPNRITPAWLRERGAGAELIAVVALRWPGGVPVTRRALVALAQADLTVSWLAQFLPAEDQRAFDAAVAQAQRAFELTAAEALADVLGLP